MWFTKRGKNGVSAWSWLTAAVNPTQSLKRNNEWWMQPHPSLWRHFSLWTVPWLFHVLLKTKHMVLLNENKWESVSDEPRLKAEQRCDPLGCCGTAALPPSWEHQHSEPPSLLPPGSAGSSLATGQQEMSLLRVMYDLQTLCTRRSWYWWDYLLWRTRYHCMASCPAGTASALLLRNQELKLCSSSDKQITLM